MCYGGGGAYFVYGLHSIMLKGIFGGALDFQHGNCLSFVVGGSVCGVFC